MYLLLFWKFHLFIIFVEKERLERMYRIMFLSFRLLHQRNLRISERPHLNLKGSSSWLLPKRGSRIRRKIQSWPNLRELKTPGLKWIQFLALKTSHIKLTSFAGFFSSKCRVRYPTNDLVVDNWYISYEDYLLVDFQNISFIELWCPLIVIRSTVILYHIYILYTDAYLLTLFGKKLKQLLKEIANYIYMLTSSFSWSLW